MVFGRNEFGKFQFGSDFCDATGSLTSAEQEVGFVAPMSMRSRAIFFVYSGFSPPMAGTPPLQRLNPRELTARGSPQVSGARAVHPEAKLIFKSLLVIHRLLAEWRKGINKTKDYLSVGKSRD